MAGAALPALIDVVNPATEEPFAQIAGGNSRDVDRAVAAARAAFPSYAMTSREERIALLQRIDDGFKRRREDLAQAMSHEMGVPITGARNTHFPSGPAHLQETIKVLATFAFETRRGTTMVAKEPIGVCALITPWNFPVNQVICKVAPALAAGLHDGAQAQRSIAVERAHHRGNPARCRSPGRRVQSGQRRWRQCLARDGRASRRRHGSFTGSTRAGIGREAAADTVKRVAQELGGKSPNILLPDADFERAVSLGVARLLQQQRAVVRCSDADARAARSRLDEVAAIARKAAEGIVVGMPSDEASVLGPVANRAQFEKVQRLIETGIAEGARVVAGGPGRPAHLSRGFFVRPTVFVDVDPRHGDRTRGDLRTRALGDRLRG